MGSKLSTLIGIVVVIVGIYLTWKLIKAVGVALIVIGLVLVATRALRN